MSTDALAKRWNIDLHVRQFPLHPETPPEGITLEALFAGRDFDIDAAQRRIAARMAEVGLPFGERTMTYNSRRAQELATWAVRQPGGDAIHDPLYRAYFADGRNLFELDTLGDAAAAAGLDREDALEAVRSGSEGPAVDADWARSRSLGVTGVPTWVAGGRGVVGAQPLEALEQLAEAAGASRRPESAP